MIIFVEKHRKSYLMQPSNITIVVAILPKAVR